MITFLDGTLEEALPARVVVAAGGVGYEVLIPLSTYERLPVPPAPIKILTYLAVRETEHVLYGFSTQEERDLFRLLVAHVSGVGPKMALSLLSGCDPSQFKQAVFHGDVAFLSGVKGVGKKTAERIIVELKDKFNLKSVAPETGTTISPVASRHYDAVQALIALGYKPADATKAIEKVKDVESSEEMIREALKLL